MRIALSFAFVGLLASAAWIAEGCGSDSNGSPGDAGTSDGGGSLESGLIGIFGEASARALVVTPANPTLAVTAPGATEQFTATLGGANVSADWSIDVANVGTIDKNGLFKASALAGGPVNVTATSGALQGSTTMTIHLAIVDNPGNVPSGTQQLLQGGGNADAAFTWLYPYDQTVFPRDLPSPSLQFGLTVPATTIAFDAALVHVSFANLDYQGFFGPTAAGAPAQIQLPAAAWTAITQSSTGSDAVRVDVTKIAGGAVSGPITHTWTIAPGNLRGTIFYNSYNSAIAAPPPGSTFPAANGAVLKMRPGQTPTLAIPTNNQGECHVCHAVSANGTILESSNEANGASYTPSDGVYDLTNNGAPLYSTTPDGGAAYYRVWDFGAFYPDGTKFLRYGTVPYLVAGQAWAPNARGLGEPRTPPGGTVSDNGDRPSALFDPKTGAPIAAPGLDAADGGTGLHMMMPVFSSDGKHVAFNHYDTGLGQTIAVMDFDAATNTFSNVRDVATLPAGQYPGWPTFTPDDEYVFFAVGTNNEYSTIADSPPPQPTSDIYIAHVGTATMATADQLNGFIGGTTYLPFPTDQAGQQGDPHLNFEPAILPVAAGGYYWVVFTSRRSYGNTVNGDAFTGAGGAPSPRKKLWVAAISIDSQEHPATKAADNTHPAFYLDGQELGAGNMRAFWALDPCEQNGRSCETGDQCCSGFCRQTDEPDGAVAFTCVPPNGCARESERCATASDCCGAASGTECINGYCASPVR